jgi:UDPglucose 6-dehydrogenase
VKLAVIGCWHQGVVGAAGLAERGHDVVGQVGDAATAAKLNGGVAPLFEPGLDELLAATTASGRLHFMVDPAEAVTGAEVVLIMHDTPVDEDDRSDLSGIYSDVQRAAPSLTPAASVYVTAQVPVGTCDDLAARIRAANPGWGGCIAYSPENLRLGQALERFRTPPLPVIGIEPEAGSPALDALLAEFPVTWKRVTLRTAEMSKHALNAFLATSICFANELGNLCDRLGADGHQLAGALRLEPRIGAKAMLFPGLGFSGGTLARDLQTLRGFGDALGVETRLLDGAWAANQAQNLVVVETLRRRLDGLAGRRIAVLGLTYKPDTSTLRRSAALEVIAALTAEGAVVAAHDPKADRAELVAMGGFTVCDDPLAAASGADALVLMTPWADYRALDPAKVKAAMNGTLVFDTANFWPLAAWEQTGLEVLTIGRGRSATT